MKRLAILLLLLVSSTALSAVTVWKWVDKNGVPHYTDHEVPGAVRIELDGVPSVSGAAPASIPVAGAPQQPGAPSSADAYQAIVIASPMPQQTLWNIGSILKVEVRLSPALRAGDHLDVVLDGKRQDLGLHSLSFNVPKVYRGVHTMQAVVLNSMDEEVAKSAPVTFMVQETSVLNPNNRTPAATHSRAPMQSNLKQGR